MKPALFLKALSDETRLYLCLLIHAETELCVCELMAALDESQPKISRHLAYLRNCGVLQDQRRGQWVYYTLAQEAPAWAKRLLKDLSKENLTEYKRYQLNLKNMKNRPQCC